MFSFVVVVIGGVFSSYRQQLVNLYSSNCANLAKRFVTLLASFGQTLHDNNLNDLASLAMTIHKCTFVLADHVSLERNQQQLTPDEAYVTCLRDALAHFMAIAQTAHTILADTQRSELSRSDIAELGECFKVLGGAKENVVLSERLAAANVEPTLGQVFEAFVQSVLRYFAEISKRIEQALGVNASTDQEAVAEGGQHSSNMDHIGRLVAQMDAVRTIDDTIIRSRTDRDYYRLVDNLHGFMQRIQDELEKPNSSGDNGGVDKVNYSAIAKSLKSFVRNAEWLESVKPGAYDELMRKNRDLFIQQSQQSKERFEQLDLRLKSSAAATAHGSHIVKAKMLVAQLEDMRALEGVIGELAGLRECVCKRFVDCVKLAFTQIGTMFADEQYWVITAFNCDLRYAVKTVKTSETAILTMSKILGWD